MTQALITIPEPRNKDGRARLKIAIMTDVGYKGNGVVSYEEDEFINLLHADGDWFVCRTLDHREGNSQWPEEVLCVAREHIVAWAIAPLIKATPRIVS